MHVSFYPEEFVQRIECSLLKKNKTTTYGIQITTLCRTVGDERLKVGDRTFNKYLVSAK